MGQWLSERTGQQFVIENRPGAGTNLAAEAVVNAPPDGYTLLSAGVPNAINATLYDKLNFDFVRDIAPVAGVFRVPFVMEVNPSVSAKTITEFIPLPGLIQARSTWRRPATAARPMRPVSCSNSWPGWTWYMCRIAVRRPR